MSVIFLNPLSGFFFVAHFLLVVGLITKNVYIYDNPIEVILYFILGFSSTILFYIFFALLFYDMILSRMFIISYFLTFSFLALFHYRSGSPLDYPLIVYNFNEIFNMKAFDSIFGSQPLYVYVIILIPLLYVVLLFNKIKQSLINTRLLSPMAKLSCFIIALSFFILINMFENSCPFGSFYKSYISTINNRNETQSIKFFTKRYEPSKLFSTFKDHHVFLIIVESFSSAYFKTKDINGKEYTPFLNQLTRKSLVIDDFYNNTIQTSRSQFGILCGLLPGFGKKEFTDFVNLNLNCLPKILKNNDYHSMFFKAYHDIGFDNTYSFTKKIGFETSKGMDSSFVNEEDKKFIWGWGLQDNIFYKKVFKYLDQQNGRDKYFITLTTVTNHMMFNFVPLELRRMYLNPKSVSENYANTIHLTDEYLSEFFNELHKRPEFAKSIIIITGDNGYPTGQHNYYHNEASYFEEFFRTPLIIYSSSVDLSKIDIDGTFSHLDLAPTILDMLGIQVYNGHFYGKSIFSNLNKDRVIPMSQPYAGTYLILVKNAYKYVYHKLTGVEFLYNLKMDPLEKNNLASDPINKNKIDEFRSNLSIFESNQYLLENNGFYEY